MKPGLAFLLCMLCYHFFTASITHAQSGGLPQAGSMISVDYKSLISKADLDFNERLGGPKAERGLPIGNGRMGTLLWTAPEQSKLHMQVNHTDVFAFRNSSASTRRDRGAPGQAFYCNGCGFVDIDLGKDVFTETAVRNHLAVYDAVAEVAGQGNLAANDRDNQVPKPIPQPNQNHPQTALPGSDVDRAAQKITRRPLTPKALSGTKTRRI